MVAFWFSFSWLFVLSFSMQGNRGGGETKRSTELFNADGQGIVGTSTGFAAAIRRALGRPILRVAASTRCFNLR